MEPVARDGNRTPLAVASVVLGALFLAVVAAPFIAAGRGPFAFRPPVEKTRGSKGPDRERLDSSGEATADLEGLRKRLAADIETLAFPLGRDRLPGRVAGSPGARRAAELIRERFEKAGLANVCLQEFPVTVPVTRESSLTAGGQPYPVHPFWPNMARTCTIDNKDNEFNAPLVYGGDGHLEDFAGQNPAGSILVLDGDQGLDWVTACSLGARAILFLEPESALDVQVGRRVLVAALDIPRFWVPRAEGLKLVSAIKEAREAGKQLSATLKCRVDWESRTACNVYGLLPGRNPARQKKATLLMVPYDSPSLVPDLAPGAEPASNVAALFELLERFKAHPPERPVLVLAVGAHYQALLGEQHAADLLRRSTVKTIDQIGELDGLVLGIDSRKILIASGVAVSGLVPWQRVMLILLGAVTVGLAVLLFFVVRGSRRARWLSALAMVMAGAVGLAVLGAYLGRERKASAGEQAGSGEEPWKACGYGGLRAELAKLERVDRELAAGLLAIIQRREDAERKAVAARGELQECYKQEEKRRKKLADDGVEGRVPPPADWTASFSEAVAALDVAAREAADFQAAGERPDGALPGALVDYRQMRKMLEDALENAKERAAGRKGVSLREIEGCLTALANIEERHKNEYSARLKYLRYCGYLRLLGSLGADMPERVASCVGLDLSSHAVRMAAFYKGQAVNEIIDKDEKRLQNAAAPVAEFLASDGTAHGAALKCVSTEDLPFVSDTSVEGGRPWGSLASACPYFGTEIMLLAGIPSVTLGSANDGRTLLDSPLDLPDNMDLDRLGIQVEVAVRSLYDLFGSGSAGVRGLAAVDRMEAQNELRSFDATLRISGLVTEYNPAKSRTLSVTPVPGALVFTRREAQAYRGALRPPYAPVRSFSAALADEWGGYEFFMLPTAKIREWNDQEQTLTAFLLERSSGRIVQAIDQGEQGSKRGKPVRAPKGNEDGYFLSTFPCSALNIFEISDLRSLEAMNTQFTDIQILLGQADAVPISWGTSMAGQTDREPFPEHAMVVFVSPQFDAVTGQPRVVRVKGTLGRPRLAGVRWPFLSSSGEGWTEHDRSIQERDHTGKGVDVRYSSRIIDRDSGKRIPATLLMAQDLYRLDDYRLYVLDKAGVRNSSLLKQHELAGTALAEAEQAAADNKWDRMLSSARASWQYEARLYPNIQGTITDVVKGLLFYLFLMLPFAYFVERLIFAFPDINRQLAGIFGVFMATFALLFVMHPAFRITSSAPMILLAFITVALAVLVISMISSRFKRELEAMQHRPGRGHKADMDRFNAAISAFLLGINNMRRRKVRTVLTMVTLVLLTFSVLSFSSIESTLGANRRNISQDREQPYQGVLIRNENWATLDEFAYRCLRNEFGAAGDCLVAPRAWVAGDNEFVSMCNEKKPESEVALRGLLGVLPEESEVSGLGREEVMLDGRSTPLLKRGRWFRRGEESARVCVLSEDLMAKLGLSEDDVRAGAGYDELPGVLAAGERLAVVGVLSDAAWHAFKDIDDESPVPVDLSVENYQRGRGRGAGSEALEFRKYTHLDPRIVPVVPYGWLTTHGGRLYSVALKPNDPRRVNAMAEEELLRRISVPMFVSTAQDAQGRSQPPSVTFMSTANSSNVSGMGSLLVPMLIAALIVLNTMLGAVYEREKEISIYGALGLAPVHIGSLFIAESAVFAVVSAVLGYVLGQSVAKLVVLTGSAGLLGGISLNYSSLSAVFTACFIIAVVMLSAAYPAFRAGRLSVPDVERIWKFPEPDGDRLVFDFPFTVSGEQALGVNMHLVHFFKDHANQSVGDFYTADTGFNYRDRAEGGRGGYRLFSRVWIAPFDFGISQTLELETFLSPGETDIFETRMILTRASGSPEAWVKMNHRFMKGIRKQFLLWRLFSPEERSWHVGQARTLLGEAPPTGDQARPAAESAAAPSVG